MISIFTNILTISMQAAIAGTIIILFKKIFAFKINVRISYYLWILVLFRLVLPILPQSPISIFNAANFNIESKISQLADINSYKQLDDTASKVILPAEVDSSTGASVITQNLAVGTPSTKPISLKFITTSSIIWAIGAFSILFYLFLVNIIFNIRLKKMTQITPPKALVEQLKLATKIHLRSVKFVEGEDITSPCVFGIINCTIILPKDFLQNAGEDSLTHVLTHEFAHIKHFDLAISWLTSIICAIHWFNPMIWYFSKLIKSDQELCADAYTMSLMDEEDILGYGQTLLSIVKQSKKHLLAPITAGITEDKRTLKQRFINIVGFTKNKYHLTFIGIIIIAIAGIFLCTSQMNYPKTGQESMNFDDNIVMNFNLNNSNDPKNFELQISNNNEISIHSCELEIYDGNPYKPESNLIYSNKNFRISGENHKSFDLVNIDYNNAQVKFKYKFGVTFNKYSNRAERSGDLRALDNTLKTDEWSTATKEEINAFIKENNINSIAVNQIYNFYTIVIFESGDTSGYYELYKDNKSSELRSRRVVFNTNNEPLVRLMGGTASGNFPFINFKINSSVLLALGNKIEIETTNGTITWFVSGITAHTVQTRGYGNVYKILIYDKNEKLIYDGEKLLFEGNE